MFFWLVVSSIVTGIGVIFEAPGEIHELKRWWKLKRLNKPVGWKVPVTFFGLVLVIGGIIGEGIFEYLSADAETAIRQHDEQVLGDTILQAGDAKDSANAAGTSAKAAEAAAEGAGKKAEAARKEADTFEADIRSAKANSANANNKAAEAESHLADALERAASADRRATEASLESLRLRGLLADRELTDSQMSVLEAKLAKYRGQRFTVTAYWDSKESLAIANRIADALIASKWSYFDEGSKSMLLGGVVGVLVWSHPNADKSTKDAANSLVKALNDGGIEAAAREQNPTNNPKHNNISISIGGKR